MPRSLELHFWVQDMGGDDNVKDDTSPPPVGAGQPGRWDQRT